MRCVVCRAGATQPGETTVTLERDGAIIVMRRVPAGVCENCGEAYVSEEGAAALMTVAEGAVRASVQLEVGEFTTAQATAGSLPP